MIAAAFVLAALLAGAPSGGPALSDWRPLDPDNTLVVDTTAGRIVVEMRPELAPQSVARVKLLAREHVYDGLLFHRVIDRFVDQTGNPNNKDGGVSAHPNLPAEFDARISLATLTPAARPIGAMEGFIGSTPVMASARLGADGKARTWGLYCAGVVGMGRQAGEDTGNSEIFFMREAARRLDHDYTVWGRVVSGEAVVRAVKIGFPPKGPDKMLQVRVMADMPAAERPRIEVLSEHGAAFAALIARTRQARGADFSPCEIDIPTRPAPMSTPAKSEWVLGVIGGSGLYEIDGLKDRRWLDVQGPWGAPSDQLLTGELDGITLVFLPRHGRGHRIPPGELNARANIDALKRAGCTDILSISAVGSLREHLPPGAFVAVDQFIDRTKGRVSSFFGEGCVAHVSMAEPTCPRLSKLAAEAGRAAGSDVQEGGTYLVMEGPQFSTRAESLLYRSWGCDVIGMTGFPEAKLAREAELPYASICMVTDYDAWHDEHEAVEVGHILKVLHANAAMAKDLVRRLVQTLSQTLRTPSPSDTCLDTALITAPEQRDPALLQKLDAVAGRALKL